MGAGGRVPLEERQLRTLLLRRRQVRRAGLAVGVAAVGTALQLAFAEDLLPSFSPLLVSGAASAIVALIATRRLVLGLDGVLYFQPPLPAAVAAVESGAIEVREAGNGRGRGAFATRDIKAGECLGDYPGILIDNATFLTRYPSGSPCEYGMAVDTEYVRDAAPDVALQRKSATLAFLNHARKNSESANVARYMRRRERRATFFAARDVRVGEELRFDYGAEFWRGREHQELP